MRLRGPPLRPLKSKEGEETHVRGAERRPGRGSPCERSLGIRGASGGVRRKGPWEGREESRLVRGELRVCTARRASELVTCSVRWGNSYPEWDSHHLGDTQLVGTGVIIESQKGTGSHNTLRAEPVLEPGLFSSQPSPRKVHLISLTPGQLQEKPYRKKGSIFIIPAILKLGTFEGDPVVLKMFNISCIRI